MSSGGSRQPKTKTPKIFLPRPGGPAAVLQSPNVFPQGTMSFTGAPTSTQQLHKIAMNTQNDLKTRIDALCEWIKTNNFSARQAQTIKITTDSVFNSVNERLKTIKIENFYVWKNVMQDLKCLFQIPIRFVNDKNMNKILQTMIDKFKDYPKPASFFGWFYKSYLDGITDHKCLQVLIRGLSEPIHLKYAQKIKNDDSKTREQKQRQLKQLYTKVKDRHMYSRQFLHKLHRETQLPVQERASLQKHTQIPVQRVQQQAPLQKQTTQKQIQIPVKKQIPVHQGFSLFGGQGQKQGQHKRYYSLFGDHGLSNIYPEKPKVFKDTSIIKTA